MGEKEMTLFGEVYAKYYDTLYFDKDYKAECDILEEIFKRHTVRAEDILDIGCGTGNHFIELTKRGYNVFGVEPSMYMRRQMEKKIGTTRMYTENIQDLRTSIRRFDVAISMFAVMNYLINTNDLIQAIKNVRRCLRLGGLFIFDFWYGPAVTWIKPNARVKRVVDEDITVERIVEPEWDLFLHIVSSHYTLRAFKDNKIIDEAQETHTLRYFFPQEIIYLLQSNRFKVLDLCKFMDLYNYPSVDDWNAMIVAKAV